LSPIANAHTNEQKDHGFSLALENVSDLVDSGNLADAATRAPEREGVDISAEGLRPVEADDWPQRVHAPSSFDCTVSAGSFSFDRVQLGVLPSVLSLPFAGEATRAGPVVPRETAGPWFFGVRCRVVPTTARCVCWRPGRRTTGSTEVRWYRGSSRSQVLRQIAGASGIASRVWRWSRRNHRAHPFQIHGLQIGIRQEALALINW